MEDSVVTFVEREYPYKTRKVIPILSVMLCGISAILLATRVQFNNGVYWILWVCIISLTVIAARLIIQQLGQQQRIILTQNAIILPKALDSSEEITIAYRQIFSLSKSKIRSRRLLHIGYMGGNYTIYDSLLPSKSAFVELCELLANKVYISEQTLNKKGTNTASLES
jgi:hypothetical protein